MGERSNWHHDEASKEKNSFHKATKATKGLKSIVGLSSDDLFVIVDFNLKAGVLVLFWEVGPRTDLW